MEGGVAQADVEGGGGAAGDEAGNVEEGGEERFIWVSVVWLLIFNARSEGGEDEEDGRCEEELDHHVERCGKEWEVEVEVFGREHPFVVLRQQD